MTQQDGALVMMNTKMHLRLKVRERLRLKVLVYLMKEVLCLIVRMKGVVYLMMKKVNSLLKNQNQRQRIMPKKWEFLFFLNWILVVILKMMVDFPLSPQQMMNRKVVAFWMTMMIFLVLVRKNQNQKNQVLRNQNLDNKFYQPIYCLASLVYNLKEHQTVLTVHSYLMMNQQQNHLLRMDYLAVTKLRCLVLRLNLTLRKLPIL
mmetsp:Transcript_108011/g.161590  ORF Transcript_108011/g.161590 Transcript_108011/m.161590 type:complete len:204 (+) Transcript_108011:846-1457(+)